MLGALSSPPRLGANPLGRVRGARERIGGPTDLTVRCSSGSSLLLRTPIFEVFRGFREEKAEVQLTREIVAFSRFSTEVGLLLKVRCSTD